ncbi:MAG: hypothetical protein AAF799_35165 [Myxococcota bacterium]
MVTVRFEPTIEMPPPKLAVLSWNRTWSKVAVDELRSKAPPAEASFDSKTVPTKNKVEPEVDTPPPLHGGELLAITPSIIVRVETCE